MQRARAWTTGWLAAASGVACGGDPVGGTVDPRITIAAESVAVALFTSAPLGAAVFHTTEAPRYVSRDPHVATVDAGGEIGGVGVGSTYVVAALASHPTVRDSVRVRVYSDSCGGARPDLGGLATADDRSLFAYGVDAPLNLQRTVESTSDGVEASRIAYDSPDGGVVTGMLWDPVGRSGRRPGLVLMHGLPGTARDMAAMARSYARSGAVVIAIDAPFARRAGPPVAFLARDRAEQIQLIRDLQRAVDVLRSRPDVDGDRIAYVGVSYGGAMGALFVGIERRLKAAALVVGHGGLVSHSTGPDGFRHIAALPCAMRVAWIRAMAPIEPVRFVGHASIPLLLQNGTSDELIPAYEAAELHAAAPRSSEVRWYAAGHDLDSQAGADRHAWLHAQIGLDPPR